MSARLPLVSIALATYNGAAHLRQQMDSLLAQDYPHLEIVVSDDGSSDDTVALLRAYAAADARIRLLPFEHNRGFNQNFAHCFAACRGELISPCDQDDVWHPEKTRRLVENLGDAVAIYADSRFVDGQGQSLGRRLSDGLGMAAGDDARALLLRNSVSGHALLFRKSLLTAAGHFPDGVYYDWWLAFVACEAGRLVWLDEVLVDYRRHTAAVTGAAEWNDRAERGLRTLRGDAQRLAAMAAYPGRHQPLVKALRDAWLDWYRGLFGWRLVLLLLRHRRVLFKTLPVGVSPWQFATRYLIGYRLKRAMRPRRYLAIDQL